jgi:hypothetical protein
MSHLSARMLTVILCFLTRTYSYDILSSKRDRRASSKVSSKLRILPPRSYKLAQPTSTCIYKSTVDSEYFQLQCLRSRAQMHCFQGNLPRSPNAAAYYMYSISSVALSITKYLQCTADSISGMLAQPRTPTVTPSAVC